MQIEMLRNLSRSSLSEEEHQFVKRVHDACQAVVIPRREEMDRTGDYQQTVFDRFRELGLYRAMFPVEYGGLGMNKLMPVWIAEVLAEYCAGIATIFGASTVLAPMPIRLDGTEEQRRRYLPKFASGEWMGAFAMTEENAGSDILNLSTTATKKGDRYVLEGKKKWITNAGRADVYMVFAVTGKGRDPRGGISCFIVEKDSPGLSFGPLEDKLGIRCAPNRPVILDGVEVPEENLVGLKPNRGFLHLIRSLTRSRVCVAGLGVGLATAALNEAHSYVFERRQFNKRVVDFQAVQHMLADMLVKIEAASMLTYKAAWYALVADHPEAHKYSAIAKYHSSEIAMSVATDALQLHGGRGFVKGCPVEKMFRDAKILAIYEGTSQMLKNQIAGCMIDEANRMGSGPFASQLKQPSLHVS
ncbi:MAG TPA: acyl-CoA dehydrogenase family protein [Blastocatellia bacterium]|nr:acyl-CoA dehydrogenase family protein [Blastocatellia bacterium]